MYNILVQSNARAVNDPGDPLLFLDVNGLLPSVLGAIQSANLGLF
jgi:hypothetical protein